MSMIRHRDLEEIESAVAGYYAVRTEYMLGVKGEEIFASEDPLVTALYTIVGKKITAH